jgi:hypothetical protein
MLLSQALAARLDTCPLVDADPDAKLLACIGEVGGERALVLGRGGLDVMCALIGAGAREVTGLCRNDRPKPASADVVVVPNLATADLAPGVVGHAKRALATAGRIVLRCPADPAGRLARSVNRVLRLHGFAAVRQYRIGMQTLVTAQLTLAPAPDDGGSHATRT